MPQLRITPLRAFLWLYFALSCRGPCRCWRARRRWSGTGSSSCRQCSPPARGTPTRLPPPAVVSQADMVQADHYKRIIYRRIIAGGSFTGGPSLNVPVATPTWPLASSFSRPGLDGEMLEASDQGEMPESRLARLVRDSQGGSKVLESRPGVA